MGVVRRREAAKQETRAALIDATTSASGAAGSNAPIAANAERGTVRALTDPTLIGLLLEALVLGAETPGEIGFAAASADAVLAPRSPAVAKAGGGG